MELYQRRVSILVPGAGGTVSEECRSTAVTCVGHMATWHNSGKSENGFGFAGVDNNTNVGFGDFLQLNFQF